MSRHWELDWLRGFLLVMMFVTHLPTRFSSPLGQPFGYVSAAEGFVMLSAFMAGLIYTRRAQKTGIPAMHKAFFSRAMTVYACHASPLLMVFLIIGSLGASRGQPAVTDLLSYYLADPTAALPAALLLIYNPPLLDILPLYILLLLASPFVLAAGMRHGWRGIFWVSSGLWLCAQFGIARTLYEAFTSVTGLKVPFSETGSFETFAWQSLWVFGLWLGSATAEGALRDRKPFPRELVVLAGAVVMACLVWRHAAGQVPMPGEGGELVNRLFDKWYLGPLRMLNLFAMLVVVMHFGDWIKSRLPRLTYLEDLGAASLPVFCTHLALVMLALLVAGPSTPDRTLLADVALLATGFAVLYAVARAVMRWSEDAPETTSVPKRRAIAQVKSSVRRDIPG